MSSRKQDASDSRKRSSKRWNHYPTREEWSGRSCAPSNLKEVIENVNMAVRAGLSVKAVGSGHASSDAPVPGDILMVTDDLKSPLGNDWLNPPEPDLPPLDSLFRIEAGMKIEELNRVLFDKKLALANMGNFDGQSISGAVCTGTHGSNLSMGPIADSVVSLELVTVIDGSARPVRIEPTKGITDPDLFQQGPGRDDGWQLIQDDAIFYASVVSMGCIGVVYALTLNVVPRFGLHETHELKDWSIVKEELRELASDDQPFVDFMLFPHKDPGDDYLCFITRRKELPHFEGDGKSGRSRPLSEQLGRFIDKVVGTRSLGKFLSKHPEIAIETFRKQFSRRADRPATDWSHKIFPLGFGDQFEAWSNEISVHLEKAAEAVDAVLHLATEGEQGGLFHTGPVGVRFVGPSKHYLAMQYGRSTCTIETSLLVGTPDEKRILSGIETKLYELGGRPHWGQWHQIDAERVAMLYDRYDEARDTFRRFNASGTFSNEFSDRLFGPPA
jgi:FAD/FMN-containing dehydrogenase